MESKTEKVETVTEKIFKDRMPENPPNLLKDTNIEIQESQQKKKKNLSKKHAE